MRIYNIEKTQELTNPNLQLGHLRDDKILVRIEPAIDAVSEQGHYDIVAEYSETDGKDVIWIVDIPAIEAKKDTEIYEDIKIYIPYTADEIEIRKKIENQTKLQNTNNNSPQWTIKPQRTRTASTAFRNGRRLSESEKLSAKKSVR